MLLNPSNGSGAGADSSTQVSYEEDGEEVSKADGYGAASSMYRDDDGLEDLPYARPGTLSSVLFLSFLCISILSCTSAALVQLLCGLWGT